jgi:hypothetical protein
MPVLEFFIITENTPSRREHLFPALRRRFYSHPRRDPPSPPTPAATAAAAAAAGERASERASSRASRTYFRIKLSTLTFLSPDFICNFKRRSIYE